MKLPITESFTASVLTGVVMDGLPFSGLKKIENGFRLL